MTREELKEMMPVAQAYVDDEKREAINKELEEEAKEQLNNNLSTTDI